MVPALAPELGSCAASRRAWRSGQLDTSRGGGAGHWTHSHCLGCSTEPPLKVSDSTAFWHQVGGALRDAWRGLKSGMDEMKSGMDGELQIARFAELQEELELLGIPQERE